MTVRNILITSFILFSSLFMQVRGMVIRTDTIYVTLIQNDTTDLKLRNELAAEFASIVEAFNKQPGSLKVKLDSSHTTKMIRLTMGKINYVNTKRNLLVTGLDLAMVGANILILPFPPVIPFYLMPATHCRVMVEATPDLLMAKTKININPNGYLKTSENQKIKFKARFNKVFVKFFNELGKQHERGV